MKTMDYKSPKNCIINIIINCLTLKEHVLMITQTLEMTEFKDLAPEWKLTKTLYLTESSALAYTRQRFALGTRDVPGVRCTFLRRFPQEGSKNKRVGSKRPARPPGREGVFRPPVRPRGGA